MIGDSHSVTQVNTCDQGNKMVDQGQSSQVFVSKATVFTMSDGDGSDSFTTSGCYRHLPVVNSCWGGVTHETIASQQQKYTTDLPLASMAAMLNNMII